ncbi:MAG: hypothetical protein ISN28_06250 [Ectothiorhodospiraceae bacterium AqS1]|nr:hypothetical protein [Ectothiorhodospiraceae bacterium AqS1]
MKDIDEQWIDLLQDSRPRLMRYLQHAPQTDSDKSYLIYMALRIMEMHRILKPTSPADIDFFQSAMYYTKYCEVWVSA